MGGMQTLLEKDKTTALFETQQGGDFAREPSWLRSIRESALFSYQHLEFPTTRQEEWKYTSVAPVVTTPFEMIDPSLQAPLTLKEVSSLTYGQDTPHRLTFINGIYSQKLSSVQLLPKNVQALGLKEALSLNSELVKKHLGQSVSCERDAFSAMNAAFFRDGVFLHIPENVKVEGPIHLLFISTAQASHILSQPRNLMIAEKGSSATLIESHVSSGEGSAFINTASEVILNEGAHLKLYKIQKTNAHTSLLDTANIHLHKDSLFQSNVMTLTGQWVRNNLDVILAEESGSAILNGLYLVSNGQHVDHHTLIDHLKPSGKSRQLYKGILDGNGTAVFSGKIFVRRHAQKTDAAQTNKNLLLSKGAKVDTKPQLEIFADDVKCAHGAAVGQLEEETLFYLKSRGIGENRARSILSYAFAAEVIESIDLEFLRKSLDLFVLQRFDRIPRETRES